MRQSASPTNVVDVRIRGRHIRNHAAWHRAVLQSIACIASLSCADGTGLGNGVGKLLIVAGTDATDTVTAILSQALVAEVRDPRGAAPTGSVIRFRSLPLDSPSFYFGVYLAPLTSSNFTNFVADTIDDRGRALVVIAFGSTSGTGRVEVAVPEFGLVDTANYTILPGAAVRVQVAPKDTVLYVGASYQSRGVAVDRFGNRRADPIAYSGASAGISITSNGLVTAQTIGRSYYLASVSGRTDTGWVSVVPRGRLAVMQVQGGPDGQFGIALVNLDGSGYRWVRSGGICCYLLAPAWSPGGDKIVYVSDAGGGARRLFVTDTLGNAARVLAPATDTLGGEESPTYSHDGSWVYFSGGLPTGTYVWRVHGDGSGLTEVIGQSQVHSTLAWRPSLAPDGTRIAFVTAGNGGAVVRVYYANGDSISSWSVVGQTPRWSPVADRIAYSVSGGGPLSVVDADGTNSRQLAPGHWYEEGTYDWSPDGQWLVARGTSGLELINAQTGLVLPLLGSANFVQPAWQP